MATRFLLSAILMLVVPAMAQGALLNYDVTRVASPRADGTFVVGTLFQVGATNQLITHLGAQDVDAPIDAQDPDGADGLTGFADDDGFFRGFVDVGLWNASGTTLLGSVRVTNADPVTGSWRYHALTQGIILQANTQYLIGATVGGGIEWFLDAGTGLPPFSAGPGFSIVENRFAGGGVLVAPTSNGGATLGRWGPANAAAFIPEPATVTLGLLSIGGLLMRRRRAA